jgi:hypothetical protein
MVGVEEMNEFFIKVPLDASSLQSVYPVITGVVIDWPRYVDHNGKRYWWYNKLSTDVDTGQPCANYKYADENTDTRIWLRCDGKITDD